MSEDIWGCAARVEKRCRGQMLNTRQRCCWTGHRADLPHKPHNPGQSSAVLRLRNKGSEKTTGPFARVPLDKPLKKLISVPEGSTAKSCLPPRWLAGKCYLPQRLKACFQTPGLTRWKKRADSQKLASDRHVYTFT